MFSSLLETPLRVYSLPHCGSLIICAKNKSKRLAVICNNRGKWQIDAGGFDYAKYVHDPLRLINLLIEKGVIQKETSGYKRKSKYA
jgi:hypothetical protein